MMGCDAQQACQKNFIKGTVQKGDCPLRGISCHLLGEIFRGLIFTREIFGKFPQGKCPGLLRENFLGIFHRQKVVIR